MPPTVDNKAIGDGHPALKDKQVRLAIDYAIDRKTLVDKVLRNHGTVATGVIPPIYANTTGPRRWPSAPSTPPRPTRILDTAGYPKGADGVRAGPGRAASSSSGCSAARSPRRRSATSSTSATGCPRSASTADGADHVRGPAHRRGIGKGEYDLFEWGWVVEPDPDFQLSVFTCDQRSTEDAGEISAGWSDSFYCNSAYDALYTKQKTLIDPAARRAVIKQAQQQLYDDVALLDAVLLQQLRGVPQRPVHRLRAPADRRRRAGVPVRHLHATATSSRWIRTSSAADQKSAANRTWVILGSGLVALLVVVVVAIVVAPSPTDDRRRAGVTGGLRPPCPAPVESGDGAARRRPRPRPSAVRCSEGGHGARHPRSSSWWSTSSCSGCCPGDPAKAFAPRGRNADPERLAADPARSRHGQPWYEQFWTYCQNLAHGDLGESWSLHAAGARGDRGAAVADRPARRARR